MYWLVHGDSRNGIWWSSIFWHNPQLSWRNRDFQPHLVRMDPRGKNASQSFGLEHTGQMSPKWTAAYKLTTAWVCPNIQNSVAWNVDNWLPFIRASNPGLDKPVWTRKCLTHWSRDSSTSALQSPTNSTAFQSQNVDLSQTNVGLSQNRIPLKDNGV